jgi:hypothetical protein
VAGAVAIFALTGYGLLSDGASGVRGTVTVAGGGLTVRTDLPEDPNWFTATSWQGGGLVVDRLERIGPGVYRTTEPIPLDGEWKTMLRLHHGRTLSALPVYLPADPAIPVEGIPARPQLTREFGPEQQLLQRERKTGVAGWLWAVAYAVVLAIALTFLAVHAWGVHRVSLRGPAEREHVDQQPDGHRRDEQREPATQQ